MAQALINAVDPQVLALSEMELAEKLIFEACASSVAAVSLGAAHVMRAGGKRIRPMVLILAAKSCGCEEVERVARLSAAVELVHTATLVHDDVVDESDRRRGQYSVNTFLGNEASVLMGDYLVCRALRMIADEPDVRLMRTMCDVIVSMCEAEVLQITYRGDVENTFENYLRVIRNKTACLFSYTAMAGALLGGVAEAQVDQFRIFGLNLGIAFQIVDDILDLTGEEQSLGKPTASDLREGKFTYPVLHALRNLEGASREELLSLVTQSPCLDGKGVDRVVELVNESGGIQAAYQCAAGYAALALDSLAAQSESPALGALREVANSVVHRSR